MSDKVYVGSRVSSLEVGEPFEPISRVTMRVDEDHYYTAGDDTGRTLECENIWATQEMVDNVYNQLKGFVYKPFKATDAMIDPAAEPGDGVTVRGEYFMLTSMDTVFDAKCASTIGAPGEKEIDHEYPYMSWQEREMERRVKLGQKYQGVSITRKDGLVITETDGETDGAKVVLNSKKLAFYDAGGQEQLYFDPAEGVYKFRGALNVNDNFVVDKLGNVVMKGGITLDGPIRWGTDNVPNKKRYAASMSGPWHDTMQSGDIYCCDWDYVGEKWGSPYKFVGTDGSNGRPGSDADVTRANIVLAMLEREDEDGLYTTTINGKQCLGINASAIRSGAIEGIDIYGGTFYSINGRSSLSLTDVSGGFSDFAFRSAKGKYDIFSVSDNIGGATFSLFGQPVLHASSSGASLASGVTVHATFA